MTYNSILILGATGLIGPHLIPALKKAYPSASISALVRPGSDKIAAVQALGVKVIEQDYSSGLETAVKGYDLVIDSANSADPATTKAAVEGLKGSKATFLRLSGCGNFINGSKTGEYDHDAKLWDDSKAEDIAAIHDAMFNGAGDVVAINAAKEGLEAFTLTIGGIYGVPVIKGASSGVFVNLYSSNAKQLGYTPVIGDGSGVMQMIHIDDAVSAIIAVLKYTETASGASAHRYFIAPGFDYTWKRLAEVFGNALNLSPKTVSFEEAGFIAGLIGSTMKSVGTKTAELGWKATGPTLEEVLPQVL
ncbi:hypothetical protein TREMEDRAFT_66980 [Tremella mesenterica DSM 1558]|nr:uncharacterized protein TREMEDRAFT_66980 [Tremella mesenterica DSM 1558]EIW72641.1 hypothetical protein TREMEDRAFT_66980 [Tremella mesenterica DSM 1558]